MRGKQKRFEDRQTKVFFVNFSGFLKAIVSAEKLNRSYGKPEVNNKQTNKSIH